MLVVLVAAEIDKKHVVPIAGFGRARLDAGQVDFVGAKGCERRSGVLRMEIITEVLSLPLGGTSWLPIIKKRVELSGWSSIFSARIVNP